MKVRSFCCFNSLNADFVPRLMKSPLSDSVGEKLLSSVDMTFSESVSLLESVVWSALDIPVFTGLVSLSWVGLFRFCFFFGCGVANVGFTLADMSVEVEAWSRWGDGGGWPLSSFSSMSLVFAFAQLRTELTENYPARCYALVVAVQYNHTGAALVDISSPTTLYMSSGAHCVYRYGFIQ